MAEQLSQRSEDVKLLMLVSDCVDIQTAAHQKASLLPSPAAVVHLLQNRLLQLFGNVEQVTGNLVSP